MPCTVVKAAGSWPQESAVLLAGLSQAALALDKSAHQPFVKHRENPSEQVPLPYLIP